MFDIKSLKILVVLGSPNSPEGKLSLVSHSRLDRCIEQYKPGIKIICTGGWGAHFNTSKYAHASLAKDYLMENGIPHEVFLENALSENTVDDAVKVKEIISNLNPVSITIISSDFHIERVKLIFEEILNAYKVNFIAVKSHFDQDKYEQLVMHEKRAIESIKKNGLYY
jgi:uncharacterized SAM-binding protein YcdF (DUF218 family)